jgi:hypothetical protein
MTLAIPYRQIPLAASLFLGLLFIAVLLPTGSIFGLNIKILLFVVFVVAFAFHLAHSSTRLTHAEVLGLGLFCVSLCLWALIAIINAQAETSQMLLQLKDLVSTVVIAWVCVFFVGRRILRPERIVEAVAYGVAALSLMKLAVIAAVFIYHINPVESLESVFGEGALVGGEISLGLTRLQFSSDITGSFALFAVLCPTVSGLRFRWLPRIVLVVLFLISGLLAYSRYIWLLDGIAFIAAMSIERKFRSLATVALTIVLLIPVSYESLQVFVGERFTSDETSDSDLARVEQSRALLGDIQTRPLFGKGLGTHATAVIRSEQNRYSYELQWLALFMQFGAVGIAGILFLVRSSARDLIAAQHRGKYWTALLFAMWLLSGWTNPYLTSSFAGATFGMFMAMFYRMRRVMPSNAHALT